MALKPVVMIFGSALVASTYKDQGVALASCSPKVEQTDTTILDHINHWQGRRTNPTVQVGNQGP